MSDDQTNIAADELRAFIERIERLEEEKKEIGADIKDVYGEGKSRGYDVKVMRKLVAIRKQDQNERQEFEAILELYMTALGMGIQDRLPLADEDLRVRRPTRREKSRGPAGDSLGATIQICDGQGTPLHPPVSMDKMKAAAATVKSGGRKRKTVDATDAEDEKLRNERAKGPVFA